MHVNARPRLPNSESLASQLTSHLQERGLLVWCRQQPPQALCWRALDSHSRVHSRDSRLQVLLQMLQLCQPARIGCAAEPLLACICRESIHAFAPLTRLLCACLLCL